MNIEMIGKEYWNIKERKNRREEEHKNKERV
jgi:hypothetical protein